MTGFGGFWRILMGVVDYAIDVFIALPASDMEAVAAEVDELVKS